MSKFIKLKKGFDINLAGKAEKKIVEVEQPETFAYKPSSFHGILRPKLKVKEGDTVKAGTPILFDKKNDKVQHVAPVSGEVVEIRRGEKRKLLEIVILADKTIEYETFDKYTVSDINGLSRENIVNQMLGGGVWPNLVQRPFGVIADPSETPKAIFISAFDSHPLAPEYDLIFKGQDQYFQAGIDILKKLTPGAVHVNVNADAEVSPMFAHAKNIELNKFSGPHPAGNVGVQIHHLDPINKGDIVWTVNPFGVIQIGKLFLEGKYDASRIIAVAGSEVTKPQYYKTYTGASIKKFIEGNLNSDHVRFVSGNALTGHKINADGHLGYFDSLLTVLPEGDKYELFGWIKPTTQKLSFQRAFGLFSFMFPNKEYALDTNVKGEPRAFVQTGIFEKVTPMDILPTYLLKAILAEDYDDMEALGIYEIIEEDLALCEFIDVSKHDIQDIVREGLDLMRYS
ncbi:Na(+)-translocating NADH-quinone reductase subunit A [Fulvivirga kasyanovii]|uniref:Na(+)-translocating NADH-quinone reductase subunit A n=1 Tax=Fulvivirga kasyanovii TaxID=396812 RepID=A0ABW9RTN7_9BACT|nr:Na(+)-translocating NADH-quinone reductase subunit A [Fulvivirga kasyanovii]MTI27057.1 Na(+)-translocating NADH-quinone reductase subunit A [Fulvivirga kasyanovii]